MTAWEREGTKRMNTDASFVLSKLFGQVGTKPKCSKIDQVPTLFLHYHQNLFLPNTSCESLYSAVAFLWQTFEHFPFPRGKLLPFSRGLTTVYKALFLLGHSDIINSLFALLG